MLVFGLTGGIGSGKSAVATLLKEAAIPVVAADDLAREVVAPGTKGLDEIFNLFGHEILDASGHLDRAEMGRQIFSCLDKRKQLEQIIHPKVREALHAKKCDLERQGHPFLVYEIPLLFETKSENQFDGIIVVSAPLEQRIARIKQRDHSDDQEIQRRISTQMPDEEKRIRADYIVENDGDIHALTQKVQHLIRDYLLPKATQTTRP